MCIRDRLCTKQLYDGNHGLGAVRRLIRRHPDIVCITLRTVRSHPHILTLAVITLAVSYDTSSVSQRRPLNTAQAKLCCAVLQGLSYTSFFSMMLRPIFHVSPLDIP